MRETLFVFPRDLVPAAWGSAAARIASVHRNRFIKDLERWGSIPNGDGAAWLADAKQAVLDHLADGAPRSAAQVRKEVPGVSGVIVQAPDKKWGGEVPHPLSSRQGYAEIIHRWLWSYGPGTVGDIAWWLGGTKATVRAALGDLGAVAGKAGTSSWARTGLNCSTAWATRALPCGPMGAWSGRGCRTIWGQWNCGCSRT